MTPIPPITPQTLAALIRDQWPAPAEPYEQAYSQQELIESLKTLTAQLAGEHTALTGRIISEGLTAEGYTLIIPQTDEVSIEALRAAEPDIYAQIVYLREADIRRILGRKRLYEAARNAAGADRIAPLERINVADMCRHIPADEQNRYLIAVRHEHLARVVRDVA